jgi:hypothetical protein
MEQVVEQQPCVFLQIVDDAVSKIGAYTPGYHALIVDKSKMLEEQPDYVIILAWPYAKFIIKNNIDYIKRGGIFCVPLPTIKFIDNNNYIDYIDSIV